MNALVDRLLRDRDELTELDDEAARLRTALADDEIGPVVAALAVVDTLELPDGIDPVDEADRADDRTAVRWLAVAASLADPDIDERLDERLADDQTAAPTIEALVRAGTDWHHPALIDGLRDDDRRFGAATLLATTAPDELEEAFVDIDSTPALVELIRAASIAGDPEWFDRLVQWRNHLADDADDRVKHRLDGAVATVDPDRFARLLLGNEITDEWLGDDRAVADFLTRHGTNAWLAPLAVFRHVHDTRAFELTAAFATCAAYTLPFEEFDDEDLDPTRARALIDADPRRCSYQLAMTEDTQLEELLVEATLHQTLARRGARPPAMTGLPLSGHPPEPDALDARLEPLRSLSMDQARDRLAVVRTLTDLHRLVRRGHLTDQQAAPVFAEFAPLGDAPDLVATMFNDDRPVGRTDDWGCRGIAALDWWFDTPDTDSLCRLARRWFDAPLERSALYRPGFEALVEAVD